MNSTSLGTLMTFSDEQAMLLESASAFCREKSPVNQVRQLIKTEVGFDASVWDEMVRLGWCGLAVPDELGGSAMTLAEAVCIAEPMGRHLLASPFLSTQLFAQGLLAGGSEQQQLRYLPALCEGAVGSVALFETDGSWDLNDPLCVATKQGAQWHLAGTKTLVCDAAVAKHFLVSVKIDGQAALVILDAKQLSASASRREVILDETRRAYSVCLDGISVGVESLIQGEKARAALQALRNGAMLLYSAEAAGGIAGTLDIVLDYLTTRSTFGRKIGSYQSLKHTCADVLIGMERTRSHVYHAASLVAAGAHDDLEVALRMAKAEGGDSFVFAGDRAVQFHGGFGFTYECDAQLYLRRALWIQHSFGDAQHQRRHLGNLLLNKNCVG